MSVFLPQCATYIEDGANFIDGDKIKQLLEVSTDEYKNFHCSKMLNYEHSDLIMEAKCPYPNEDQLPVHYNIPV